MRTLRWVCVPLILACLAPWLQAGESLIRPGDRLSIIVMGEPDLTRQVVVDPEGRVSLPLVKEVAVANLSPVQAAETIAKALKDRFIKNPEVIVEVTERAKVQVAISGEVRNPGVYAIPRDARLIEVIASAGGYTANADLSRISISHADDSALETVDLSAFLLGGDASANMALSDGDTVVVPGRTGALSGAVLVLGAVRQPGEHSLTPGMTVREAITLAGGPTEVADLGNVTLRHSDSVETARINYWAAVQGDAEANPELKPGDVIFVGASEQLGYYTIHGAVNSPGRYELRGRTTITEAIAIAGGVRDRAKLGDVRILRPLDTGPTTLRVNVSDIMAGKSENVVLRDQDNVYVRGRKEKIDILRWASLALSLAWLLTRH